MASSSSSSSGAVWREVNQHLRLSLPEEPYSNAWRTFTVELFRRVEEWQNQEQRCFSPKRWDFCVIHSKRREDTQKARALRRMLETSLGLYGCVLDDMCAGECTMQAAEVMVGGSTKVFILVTPHMNKFDEPKYIFWEALMGEIRQPRWRCKVVPLLENETAKVPFGLRGLKPIIMGEEAYTAEMISREIGVEGQMDVRAARSRAQANNNERLGRLRASRHQEIREVVAGLRRQFGDSYDPTSQLDQMTEALHSMTLDDLPGVEQQVNVNNCSNVSVGTSIHFNIKCDPATPTDHAHTPTASSTTTSTPSSDQTSIGYTTPSANHVINSASTIRPTPTSDEILSHTPLPRKPTSTETYVNPYLPSTHATTSGSSTPTSSYTRSQSSNYNHYYPSDEMSSTHTAFTYASSVTRL